MQHDQPLEVRRLVEAAQQEKFSGFIIVRLKASSPPARDGTLLEYARQTNLEALEAFLTDFGSPPTERAVSSVPVERLLDLERRAAADDARLPSLTRYWRIDARAFPSRVDEAIQRLSRLGDVDEAYRELSVTEPAALCSDQDFAPRQAYLDAAPLGIGARWAWTQPNGLGASVGLGIVEQGWFLRHQDVGAGVALVHGDNRDGIGTYVGDHGTSVLGIAAAAHDAIGVAGIAPAAGPLRLASHYRASTDTDLHVADAIVALTDMLDPGDVLLLEVQRAFQPTEVDSVDFTAIKVAVAAGLVVVEAAGNGDLSLDGIVDAEDSGAILVGAAIAAVPHQRWRLKIRGASPIGSCFGKRVDCYAWGEQIVTCGGGDLCDGGGDKNRTYTGFFNGTSGAAAIVAGAAVLLQGLHKGKRQAPLSPKTMRQILRTHGTSQGRRVPGHIGKMPDLKKAARAL